MSRDKTIIKCVVLSIGKNRQVKEIFFSRDALKRFFENHIVCGYYYPEENAFQTDVWELSLITMDNQSHSSVSGRTMDYTRFQEFCPNIAFEQDIKTQKQTLDKMPPDGYFVIGETEMWQNGLAFDGSDYETAKQTAQDQAVDNAEEQYIYELRSPIRKCIPKPGFEWEEI